MKKLVLGIVGAENVNALLDNLSEADFNHVSVVMQDQKRARELADDTGPLKGCTLQNLSQKLSSYTLPEQTIKTLEIALQKGNAVLALTCPQQSAESAKEMFVNGNALEVFIG